MSDWMPSYINRSSALFPAYVSPAKAAASFGLPRPETSLASIPLALLLSHLSV
jgi:hypothetical protein